ncbi:hypothetical protein Pelo_9342 [Pelomyxa schiedti]|nr:hypothetical protein Pelo_9342 [Pelomyxa schiedti]
MATQPLSIATRSSSTGQTMCSTQTSSASSSGGDSGVASSASPLVDAGTRYMRGGGYDSEPAPDEAPPPGEDAVCWDDVMCPMCAGVYEDPVVLSCGHTFCRGCVLFLIGAKYLEVEEVSDKDDLVVAIECPLCKANPRVLFSGNGLVPDKKMGIKIDLWHNPPCQWIEDCPNKSMIECPECGGLRYCQICWSTAHAKTKSPHHPQYINLSNRIDDCPLHMNEPLAVRNWYCNACQQPVCSHCKTHPHNSHNIVPLHSVQSDLSKQCEEELHRHTHILSPESSDITIALESQHTPLMESLKSFSETIDLSLTELEARVQQLTDDARERLQAQKMATEKVIEYHSSLCSLWESAMLSSDEVTLFLIDKKLKELLSGSVEMSPLGSQSEGLLIQADPIDPTITEQKHGITFGSIALYKCTTKKLCGGSARYSEEPSQFSGPRSIVYDPRSKFFILADSKNHTIRAVYPTGQTTLLSGTPEKEGTSDGVCQESKFSFPMGVALNESSTIYVTNSSPTSCTLRKIDQKSGLVFTCTSTGLSSPQGVVIYQDKVLFAEKTSHCITVYTEGGGTSVLAGSCGQKGFQDGPYNQAQFYLPTSLCVLQNVVYVAQAGCIRVLADGLVTTLGPRRHLSEFESVDYEAATAAATGTTGDSTISTAARADAGSATATASTAATGASASKSGIQDDTRPEGPILGDLLSAIVHYNGSLLVADTHNDAIMQVTFSGLVSTLVNIPRPRGIAVYPSDCSPSGAMCPGDLLVSSFGKNKEHCLYVVHMQCLDSI